MVLVPSDVARLTRLGYRFEDFAVVEGDLVKLRNVDGYCYFYDREERRCRIYEERPLGCRVYPIVVDLDEYCVRVDPECPAAETVELEDVYRVLPLLHQILRELGLTHIIPRLRIRLR